MSNVIYAMGDIHGEISKLRRLYAMIRRDFKYNGHKEVTIVFLGDYIDRGEDSKAVLDFLMNLEDTDEVDHVFLFGNHEEFMVHAFHRPSSEMSRVWLMNGGMKCIQDFGYEFQLEGPIMDEKMIPYIDWLLDETTVLHEQGPFVFVHAGIDHTKPLDEQSRDVLLWSRVNDYWNSSYIVVHGHTIVNEPVDRTNQINVDTGSFKDDGKLTAVKLKADDTSFREFLVVK